MAKTYKKRKISIDEKEELFQKYLSKATYDRKANISGACIHFYTDDEEWLNQWDENWFFSDESIRSHGKIVALRKKKGIPTELYDPQSRTVFFNNCNYYGWIKSCALALTGDVLEDNHEIYSIHGALIEVEGKGVSILGPPKSGKTTLSYGLLRYKNTKIITDDWHFFNFLGQKNRAYGGEKNTYIGSDLGDIWKDYKKPLIGLKYDNMDRAVVDVRRILGAGNAEKETEVKTIVLLKRKKGDPIIEKLNSAQALRYLEKMDYFNPHILQKTPWKKRVRRNAFKRLFKDCKIYLLNTVETQEKTLDRLCDLAELKKKIKRF